MDKEPIVNETNRESWKNKILSKNPWMNEDQLKMVFQAHKDSILADIPEKKITREDLLTPLSEFEEKHKITETRDDCLPNSLDYKHLQSITGKDRTVIE